MDLEDIFSDSDFEKSVEFEFVEDSFQSKILKSCQDDMLGDFMNRGLCAVCDQMLYLSAMRSAKITEKFAEKCKKKLKPSGELPQRLVDYYNISEHINSLSGVLFSPRAEIMKGKTDSIRICYSCFDSLNRSSYHLEIFHQNSRLQMGLKLVNFHPN